ncbi:hypothetical protein PLICRDRAFT_167855 [Plicaturopsis crispa FD-325 SS-3]|uniref:Uncharacterized protein n=1 Tax=Plicaturopsis crispa FD-325 SS-3 TaxID=944288 RepID=A0A0C9SXE7_PLICR|nr:hypothetical protein PLICRDRAFT_167855 [Plicaturopsis crispa FD-325 SS-3]
MRSALTPLRPAIRSRLPPHRLASTNASAEAAQKKAQEALGSAQKQAERLWESTKKFLGPVGEKAGNLLGGYREPLVYNLKVARELAKQVYLAERLQPPADLPTIKSAYSTLWSRAKNPSYWREIARNGEWAKVAIYGVEAYGIFKIGEIIGRRHLVGYELH